MKKIVLAAMLSTAGISELDRELESDAASGVKQAVQPGCAPVQAPRAGDRWMRDLLICRRFLIPQKSLRGLLRVIAVVCLGLATHAVHAQSAASSIAPAESADNRIAISVVDGCHSKIAIAGDNCAYDNGDNRTTFANDLAQSLTAKGFAVVPAGLNAGRTLTVTVTGIGDSGICEICDNSDAATASANWQVTDASGMAGPNGAESSTADDTKPGLQKLADKIAIAVDVATQAADQLRSTK